MVELTPSKRHLVADRVAAAACWAVALGVTAVFGWIAADLILRLRGGCCGTDEADHLPLTMVVVTHNLAQARRIADDTAVFWVRRGTGAMIEAGPTDRVFESLREQETRQYIHGMHG